MEALIDIYDNELADIAIPRIAWLKVILPSAVHILHER
jgi:hypothetical protein